eukprot:TRINITY_DN34858_c0_g1_i2.p1 TRINITY_DN34858_c0_g1~~TRINITY_DN34858_c0_g1_i2.p1  ORF type:complete len:634 (+),score=117.32 TRINITY_DN34858_c0_g1_i2:158-2059(+)
MTNSVLALLHLWQLCMHSQAQSNGSQTVLYWATIRKALHRGLGEKLKNLQGGSLDDTLRQYFGWSRSTGGHVSFARFWRGMEAILRACSSFYEGDLDEETELKVASLRRFRDAVLDEDFFPAAGSPGCEYGIYYVRDLRRLCERLRIASLTPQSTANVVLAYWEERIHGLPDDDQTVSNDEISSALLAWLEDVLHDAMESGEEDGDVLESDESSGETEDSSPRRFPPSQQAAVWQRQGRAYSFDPRSRGAADDNVGNLPPPPQRHPFGSPGSYVSSAFPGHAGGSPIPTASGLAGSPPVEAVVRRPSFQQQLASHAGGDTWLPPSSAEPEEKRFRRLLADNLGEGDLSAASFFDFFRVVRDAVEECEEAAEAALFAAAGASTSASSSHRPRGSSTPRSGRGASGYRIASHAALRQGVARLFVVVRHRLREVYRELESIPPRPRQAGTPSRATSAPGGGDFVGHDSIFAGLICSQARTAAMLERRAQRVPWAYRLLWQLARIGRRRTLETLVHWRHLTFPASAGGAGSGEEDLGEEVSFQDVPLHSTEPQREPSAGPLRQSSAEAGSASSSPTRRWGGVGARSPTSPSASLEPEREPSAALTPASLPSSRPGSVRRASQDRGMGLGLTLQVDPP